MVPDGGDLTANMTAALMGLQSLVIQDVIEELSKCYLGNHTTLVCSDEEEHDPPVTHSMETCSYAKQIAFRFIVPVILASGLLGNILSLIVYKCNYLRKAAMLTLLAARSYAHIGFILCLTVETVHTLVGSESSVRIHLWRSRPYTLFLLNSFMTLALWITVAITAETYLCFNKPYRFNRFSKKQRDHKIIISCSIFSCLLHIGLPVMLEVEELSCTDVGCTNTSAPDFRLVVRTGAFYQTYERLHFWVQAATVIVIPIAALIVLCGMITLNLHRHSMKTRFNRQRQCMLRIVIATAFSYWILETPSLCVLISVAIRGSQIEENGSLCLTNVITNLLNISNVVASFLVSFMFNSTFRSLLLAQLRCPRKPRKVARSLKQLKSPC
uniref:G_PROTEIN_RECEP_F1_2 domain-containing protein n=1 Tax=Trichuris muris TaxID=70415 RepID=A0A5S6QNQ8_TRIMR